MNIRVLQRSNGRVWLALLAGIVTVLLFVFAFSCGSPGRGRQCRHFLRRPRRR